MRASKLIPLLLLALLALGSLPATAAAKRKNPCLDPDRRQFLRCPDLRMKRPFDLSLDRSAKPGRVVLRAASSIDNVGRGPAELFGIRTSSHGMRARQRIYRRRAGRRLGIFTGGTLFFTYIQGQTRYWKVRRGLYLQIWRINRRGQRTKLVRRSSKTDTCLRDLERTRPDVKRSPRRRVYPACSTDPRRRRETIGTSVGWSDVYPASYPGQWVDVTGLRGCFAYRHVGDPTNAVFESKERNNAATRVVRLPYRGGAPRCPKTGRLDAPRAPRADLPIEP
jgi:hypothetical protein